MQPLQQPMVQCLDLSRPDSISTTGYCADVVTQATRYPQPMLYSPAKGGLVTFEPPGKSGVEELQWLDSISRPKQVTAKSSKSRPKQSSPQSQQAQLQPHSADQLLLQPQPPQHQQQQQQLQGPHQQKPQAQVQLAAAPQQQQSHLRGLPLEAAAAVERSTVKGERAAAEAAFTAACQAERQLVSYPQAFSWGGRVKAKHSSLCRMNAGGLAVGTGTSQPLRVAQQADLSKPLTTSTSTHAGCRNSMQAGAQAAASAPSTEATVPTTTSTSNSPGPKHSSSSADGNRKDPQHVRAAKGLLDAEVAASAAQLGANADRLLNLLDRRKQKQQKQRSGQGQHRQQLKQGTQGGLHSPVDGGFDPHMQDEPICTAGVEYLRL